MNTRRDLVFKVLLISAGLAGLVSVGLWIYFKEMTIYTSLLLTAAGVCLGAAAYLRPEPIRALLDTRQAQHGSNVLVMSLLLVAILLVVNMIFNSAWPRPAWLSWLPTVEKQWDLTASQEHSLSQETIDILKSVKTPVEILAFYSSSLRQENRLLLENYTRHNPLVTLQWIDPIAQPMLATKYGVAYDGSVIFQAGERRQTATSVSEVGLSSALIKVLRTSQPAAYFSTGHGERDLDDSSAQGYSQVKSALESSGYQVRTLTTATTGTIPADASFVVVAGPQLSLGAGEADLIKAYLARGGKAMVMLDVADLQQQPDPSFGLGALLEEWGVTVRNDVVVETAGNALLSSNLEPVYIAPVVVQYGFSPITNKLNGQTIFMATRSISQTRQIEGVYYTALAQSSPQSWSVSDLAEVQKALEERRAPQAGERDARGPLTLAASLENSKTGGRLVLFGGSSFAANTWINTTASRDLVLNAANWLSAQSSEEAFTLPPKENAVVRQMQPFTLDKLLVAGAVSVCLLPLGLAAVGVWIWWRRR